MVSSPSSLTDNLDEKLKKCKCKDCASYIEMLNDENDLLVFKCVGWNKDYEK